VTIFGATGVLLSAAFFYPREEFFVGTLLISFFALSDLFDGTMARISNKGASAWGGFLDSTIDRITDSSIIIALLVSLIQSNDKLSYLGLITLVTGLLIPYIRAKAESFGIDCAIGIAERTERLVIILTAIGDNPYRDRTRRITSTICTRRRTLGLEYSWNHYCYSTH
ncbi:MAG: hypothetical protein RL249_69, partial [Actinomycetota bacterium]